MNYINPNERFKKFSRLPIEISNNKKLSYGAMILYSILTRYAGINGDCWPSASMLSKEMNTTERSIWRMVKELKDNGCIETEVRNKKSNNYYFLDIKDEESWLKFKGDTPDENVTPPLTDSSPHPCQKCHTPPDENVTQIDKLKDKGKDKLTLPSKKTEGILTFSPQNFVKEYKDKIKKKREISPTDFFKFYNTSLSEYKYPVDNTFTGEVFGRCKGLITYLVSNKINPLEWVEEVVSKWNSLRLIITWEDGKSKISEKPSVRELSLAREALTQGLNSLKHKRNSLANIKITKK